MKQLLFTILLSVSFLFAFSQSKSDIDEAYNIGTKAIELMDKGQYEESIDMLEKAMKLDPSYYAYPYEMAYAYYFLKDYKKGIKILENVVDNYKKINDQCYQLLGNFYDMDGKPDKALAIYNTGIQKFPESGNLYFEAGVVEAFSKENFSAAIEYWEKGVSVDPMYPSNYYWLAKAFCGSDDKVWGVLYGELFMNLERGSKRTEEMSNILFETYNNAIDMSSDSTASVSFASNIIRIDVDKINSKNPVMPFTMNYELLMTLSTSFLMIGNAAASDTITNSLELNLIRSSFLENWNDKDFQKSYPVVLFDYQNEIQKAGHLEAYNMWLFSVADASEFESWLKSNEKKYDDFISWFTVNQIDISDKNVFVRTNF